jgi:hypothetical protein
MKPKTVSRVMEIGLLVSLFILFATQILVWGYFYGEVYVSSIRF